MAGVTGTPRGAARRGRAAPATAEPAVEAAVERAAIERSADPIVADGVSPAPARDAEAIAADAAVVPEPTLTARPGEPLPIVTASPPVAIEPDAVDVAQARAAEAAGTASAATGDPQTTAAGQPVVTIERDAVVAGELSADDVVDWRGEGVQMAGGTDQLGNPLPPVADRVTVIEVIGPAAGRRRAGFAFGSAPRRFLSTSLTSEQLAAIHADPMLTVGISEIDALDSLVEQLREPR